MWDGDAFTQWQDQKRSQYLMGAITFDDHLGRYTIQYGDRVKYGFTRDEVSQKQYISGPHLGEIFPISRDEFYDLKAQWERRFGYIDWKGDFVPGTERKELPTILPDPREEFDRKYRRWSTMRA